MELFYIVDKIREWRYNRQVAKAKRFTEAVANGFWETMYVAVTAHGRHQLEKVIMASETGSIQVDKKVIDMYRVMLDVAPYRSYSMFN